MAQLVARFVHSGFESEYRIRVGFETPIWGDKCVCSVSHHRFVAKGVGASTLEVAQAHTMMCVLAPLTRRGEHMKL